MCELKIDYEDIVPSTEAQREIWSSAAMGGEASCTFNLSTSIILNGLLDIRLMNDAIMILSLRHDALRTTFDDMGLKIYVHRNLNPDILLIELSEKMDKKLLFDETVKKEMTTPFELAKGPLWRIKIIRQSADSHILIFTVHHVICDGWSLNVIMRDLRFIYRELKNERTVSVENMPKFSRYAGSITRKMLTEECASDEKYWIDRFSKIDQSIEYPLDFPRPKIRTYNASHVNLTVNSELLTKIKKTAFSAGVSLFALLFSVYGILIRRISGNENVIIGIPVAGQPLDGEPDLVGHCVNYLPILHVVRNDIPFSKLIESVADTLLDAQEHRTTTFGTLLKKLKFHRDPSRIPLISSNLSFNPVSEKDYEPFYELETKYISNSRYFETFEIDIDITEISGKLDIRCHYNTDLFRMTTVENYLECFKSILICIADQPDILTGRIPLMSASGWNKTMIEWNDTAEDLPYNTTLDKLIDEQAQRTPDAIAVRDNIRSVSYSRLNAWAESIARMILQKGGVKGSKIVICAERSVEMVAGMLGIIKSGAAYVPVDPDYPSARLEYIISNTQTPFVMLQKKLSGKVQLSGNVQIVLLDENEFDFFDHDKSPLVENSPEDTAYIIYTSGSTGSPKGVMIDHRGICNRLLWMQKEFRLTETDRILQKTPYTFDVSVWEFFWPLFTGATLVMACPDGHKDPAYIADMIQKEKITVVHFVPSMLSVFIETDNLAECKSLRYVICSGEALTKAHEKRFFERMPSNVRLFNLYGPTEASVDVSFWECIRNNNLPVIPIGKPISNTQLYVLDEFMEPLPVGICGQLYIGGVGLAKGYLNLPELTKECFVDNPFKDINKGNSDRLYKTGDKARWLDSGNIEFLGRLDFQVKIRGFRIELSEIECAIARFNGVVDCAVVIKEKNTSDKMLSAYIVKNHSSEINAYDMKTFLQTQLPEYMVPSYFEVVDSLPQTSSGKTDRKKLALKEIKADVNSGVVINPRNETEAAIAEIWKGKIGIPSVSINDNFFDIGGHSILLAEINLLLKQKFGSFISMVDMFQFSTIASLAEYIDKKTKSDVSSEQIRNRAKLQRGYYRKDLSK